MLRCVVAGFGAYLPERVMTNHEFASILDTSDEWIVARTGIRERHIAAPGQRTSDLAVPAARKAMEMAGVGPDQIDLVIVSTSTPDETLPATAARVQTKLGITQGAAFDLAAACSGFVYGLTLADSLIRTGHTRHALVIGAEIFSRIVDWKDRSTCILFGDGAGAFVLSAGEGSGSLDDKGVLWCDIQADGRLGDLLMTTGGVSSTQTSGVLLMQGREVFRHAVVKMGDSLQNGLTALGLDSSAIDWLIPHQANTRILMAMAERFGLNEQKVIVTLEKHANTSAASIPLAFHEGVASGRVKKGQLLAMPALGSGLTWGTCIMRW